MSTRDEKPDPQATLAFCFDRIRELASLLASPALEPPEVGSAYELDRLGDPEYGVLPFLTASGKLAVAIDHLEAMAFGAETEGVRRFASVSLLRSAFEAGPLARWLLDPSVEPSARLGRALGVARANLEWSNKTESDMLAAGHDFTAGFRRGADRVRLLEDHAEKAGVQLENLDAVALLRRYPVTNDPSQDVVGYRFASGVLHGHDWATLVGVYDKEPSPLPTRIDTSADPDITAGWTLCAVTHVARGLDALGVYARPLASDPA